MKTSERQSKTSQFHNVWETKSLLVRGPQINLSKRLKPYKHLPSIYKNHSEGLLKHRWLVPILSRLEGGPLTQISSISPGNADVAGMGGHTLRTTALEGVVNQY